VRFEIATAPAHQLIAPLSAAACRLLAHSLKILAIKAMQNVAELP